MIFILVVTPRINSRERDFMHECLPVLNWFSLCHLIQDSTQEINPINYIFTQTQAQANLIQTFFLKGSRDEQNESSQQFTQFLNFQIYYAKIVLLPILQLVPSLLCSRAYTFSNEASILYFVLLKQKLKLIYLIQAARPGLTDESKLTFGHGYHFRLSGGRHSRWIPTN